MPAFPNVTLGRDYVKTRFLEPSLPIAMAQRHLGMPRGVYLGYTPYAPPASDTLQLLRDPFHGFSMLKVGSKTERAQVDIFTNQDVALDFTGHTVWPIYVLATSDYTSGRATKATIFTRATKAVGLDEVLICKVTRVGADLVLDYDVPTNRQPPLAFAGQRFGFMGRGAIGELSTANSVGAEVITARTSVYTGAHATLKERIDDDLSGVSLANRLGLVLQNIVGNAYSGVTGSSWNVSGSFAATSRQFEPKITLEANATEVIAGVITGPGDVVRNVAFLIDELTGNRIVDESNPSTAAPTLDPIYGRITFSTGTNGVGKQINYVNASDDVTGNGTNPFVAPLQQGDLVLAPDGKFYELKTIVGPDDAVLGSAYQGTNGFVDNSTYRRFTLAFFNLSGAYTIPTARTIRLSFPAFIRLDQSIFDGLLYMRRAAELPGVSSATTTVIGKVLQATAGANAGTVSAESNTAPVGSNFHTLNFAFGGATNAGSGVANVSVVGTTGPSGADSDVGPQGNQGPNGYGYTLNVLHKKSPPVTAPGVGSWSYDFAADGFTTLSAVSSGFWTHPSYNHWYPSGYTAVVSKSGTTAFADWMAPAVVTGADFGVYLGGCGQ